MLESCCLIPRSSFDPGIGLFVTWSVIQDCQAPRGTVASQFLTFKSLSIGSVDVSWRRRFFVRGAQRCIFTICASIYIVASSNVYDTHRNYVTAVPDASPLLLDVWSSRTMRIYFTWCAHRSCITDHTRISNRPFASRSFLSILPIINPTRGSVCRTRVGSIAKTRVSLCLHGDLWSIRRSCCCNVKAIEQRRIDPHWRNDWTEIYPATTYRNSNTVKFYFIVFDFFRINDLL